MHSCRLHAAKPSRSARRGWWALSPLVAALLLAGTCDTAWAQGGGAVGQSRGAPSHRPVLPENKSLAPLRPEPGDIWAEVRSWHTGPRRQSKADSAPASAEGAQPARRPASGRRDVKRGAGVSAGGR